MNTSQRFLILYTHLTKLLKKARRILRNPDDAADAVQDAILKVATSNRELKTRDDVLAYTSATVFTTCLDYIRRGGKNTSTELDPRLADKPAHDPECRVLLTEVLANLSDRERQVVRLRFFEGCSADETAVHLGLTPGNVSVITHRIRRKIGQR